MSDVIDDTDRIHARTKINRAAQATARIDKDLWGPIQRLQDAGRGSNGAGIYSDLSRFRSALADAAAAIRGAQDVMKATEWPTDRDYDIT